MRTLICSHFIFKGFYMLPMVYFIKESEQFLFSSLSKNYTVNGPMIFFKPFMHKFIAKRVGETIAADVYIHIKDTLTGKIRMEVGPNFIFLGPNESIILLKEALSLKKDEYIEVLSKTTGKIKIIRGETSYMLNPLEIFNTKVLKAICLNSLTER